MVLHYIMQASAGIPLTTASMPSETRECERKVRFSGSKYESHTETTYQACYLEVFKVLVEFT